MSLWDSFTRVFTAGGLRPTLSWNWKSIRTGYVDPKVKNFLDKIKPAAQVIETETGIPWMFAAVQAAHESRWGLSQLTVDANNLFGITGDSWKAKGKPIYEIKTLEYDQNKVPYTLVRPFRKYAS